ncbi:MAG: hypothetical protein ACR5LD_11890 [Symbiopectobacterium sp.]
MLIIEATAIVDEGRISPLLATTVNAVKMYFAIPLGIQLGYAGRKISISSTVAKTARVNEQQENWQPIAPSSLPYDDNESSTTNGDDDVADCRCRHCVCQCRSTRRSYRV